MAKVRVKGPGCCHLFRTISKLEGWLWIELIKGDFSKFLLNNSG